MTRACESGVARWESAVAGESERFSRGAVATASSQQIRIGVRDRREMAALLALGAVGLGLLVAGWVGASASIVARKQMPWLNVAVAGLAVATFGQARWVLRGRKDLTAEITKVVALIAQRRSPEKSTARDALTTELVSAPGMRLYHRADCRFAAKKPVRAERRQNHEAAGRDACQVCRP